MYQNVTHFQNKQAVKIFKNPKISEVIPRNLLDFGPY